MAALPMMNPVPSAPAAGPGGLRLPRGGRIDRTRRVPFFWNGESLSGYEGDTLASALLAHGRRVVGRGFKLHRPRGILSAGAEEPNALVTLGAGPRLDVTARATLVRLHDGLQARAQNCWPSVDFDLGRALDFVAPLLPAGFYSKTFIWPSWHLYEPFVRRAAGLGDAPSAADPDRYEACNASCDLLVVGAGPAGLRAAQVASRAGLEVILVEQDVELGGSLLWEGGEIDGVTGEVWAANVAAELAARPNVRVLNATTAFGLYDHGTAGLLERIEDKSAGAPLRQRHWRVRARATLVATGALEQPWVFEHNDVPGVMLAGAVRQYAQRFGVAAGQRIAFATNNDSVYLAALDLVRAGVQVPLLVDCRHDVPTVLAGALHKHGVEVRSGSVVQSAQGGSSLKSIRVSAVDGAASTEEVRCDALGMSGGWAPAVHLFSHARGRLEFDATRQCFLPVAGSAPVSTAGALSGAHGLADVLASAVAAVAQECARLELPAPKPDELSASHEFESRMDVAPMRYVPHGKEHRQWIDYQHDVTVADVKLALREGFDAIELMKRYTTTGMSVDQGKTANLNALLLVAELSGRAPGQVGATTFRPPYMPVTLGALAGRDIGEFYAPRYLLPAHGEHVALGAHFEEAGGWMRPACYPRSTESVDAAIRREALAVRQSAGLFDASPLGKIEVAGRDAARFLDRFYINSIVMLEIGRTRYGLMLNENGVVIDDGTVARLGEHHYVITTTSGGAGRISSWLEEWRQCEWPDLDVFVTPVTTHWATFALAGPRAREVLARLPTDIALDAAAFPHLHVRTGQLCGVPARLYRVSFSGELGFEINVPARYAVDLWRRLLDAGRDFGLTPYGIETVLLLRLEKGFLHVGLDTDGTTSAADAGWGDVALRKKADYIGKRSLTRPDNVRSDRLQLVGLSMPTSDVLVPGAHLRLPGTTEGSDGWVTSAAASPILGKSIALAMLRGGHNRLGQHVTVHELGRTASAQVCATPFYDPKNERLNA